MIGFGADQVNGISALAREQWLYRPQRTKPHGLEVMAGWIASPGDSGDFLDPMGVANKQRTCQNSAVASRPDSQPVLTRQQLEEFARRLSMLSVPGVEGVYQTAHNDCRFDGKRLPPAAAVQQLVAAWNVLRRIRLK
jgi:hypothetical protein